MHSDPKNTYAIMILPSLRNISGDVSVRMAIFQPNYNFINLKEIVPKDFRNIVSEFHPGGSFLVAGIAEPLWNPRQVIVVRRPKKDPPATVRQPSQL